MQWYITLFNQSIFSPVGCQRSNGIGSGTFCFFFLVKWCLTRKISAPPSFWLISESTELRILHGIHFSPSIFLIFECLSSLPVDYDLTTLVLLKVWSERIKKRLNNLKRQQAKKRRFAVFPIVFRGAIMFIENQNQKLWLFILDHEDSS